MSHKSGHVIIQRSAASDSTDVVQEVRVELQFPPGTSLEDRARKMRQVECLLDKLDHDTEE